MWNCQIAHEKGEDVAMTFVKINFQYLCRGREAIHGRYQHVSHLQHRHQTEASQQQKSHASRYILRIGNVCVDFK
jgi:hypothetical protein